MAKTNAQIEKRKREVEKRKKAEKAILNIAAQMPYDGDEQASTLPRSESEEIREET